MTPDELKLLDDIHGKPGFTKQQMIFLIHLDSTMRDLPLTDEHSHGLGHLWMKYKKGANERRHRTHPQRH